MINSRTVSLTFALLLAFLLLLRFAGFHVHPALFILLVSLYLLVSVSFSFVIRSGFYMNALCRFRTTEKKVILTFDDGPDPGITPRILDILKDHGKATFFCIGRKIRGNGDLIRRMNEEGHLVGNHSYSHSNWFDFFPVKRMKNELLTCDKEIVEITGKCPRLFRPPFGVINPLVKRTLRQLDYHVIGFSLRSYDTVSKDPEKVLNRLKKKVRPGDIILLHDNVPATPWVLEQFLLYLRQNNYIVAGLDEVPGILPYQPTKNDRI